MPNDQVAAIEVEVSIGNEARNITKDLEAGYDPVVSLINNSNRLKDVTTLVSRDFPHAAVEVGLLHEFSRILPQVLKGSSSVSARNKNKEPRTRTLPNTPQDPSKGTDDEPLLSRSHNEPLAADQDRSVLLVEDLLQAVVVGENLRRQAVSGSKPRKHVPAKQERLLRLLSVTGKATFHDLTIEFHKEWERISARKTGDGAKREFFRNMTDLATRINDAMNAGYESEIPHRRMHGFPLDRRVQVHSKSHTYELRLLVSPTENRQFGKGLLEVGSSTTPPQAEENDPQSIEDKQRMEAPECRY